MPDPFPVAASQVELRTSVETCTGHRLMDYSGKCANLHGHNYRWTIVVRLYNHDPRYGIPVDFGDVRRALRAVTDVFDHSMVLRDDDPAIPHVGGKLVILNCNPSAENLAGLVAQAVKEMLSVNYPLVQAGGNVLCEVQETSNCSITGEPNEGVWITEVR